MRIDFDFVDFFFYYYLFSEFDGFCGGSCSAAVITAYLMRTERLSVEGVKLKPILIKL